MKIWLDDLRYARRVWRKRPMMTGLVLLTLALGIGATTAIFSIVHGVLLRPLPYDQPDRLAVLWESQPQEAQMRVSPANVLDWREQNEAFERISAYLPMGFNLSEGGEPERLSGVWVDRYFFEVMRPVPRLGQLFSVAPADLEARQVLLSEALWRRRYGANEAVIGQSVQLDGAIYTVIGVLPESFDFPERTVELWVLAPQEVPLPPIPLPPNIDIKLLRGLRYLNAIARLKPNATLEQAQAEMNVIARRLEEQYPEANTQTSVQVVSLHEEYTGKVRPALLMLMGAVGILLLIACVNVGGLLLTRALGRQREVAIRLALGASRWRLIRLLLTESLMLSLVGGAFGVLMAYGGVRLLASSGMTFIPQVHRIEIDATILVFTFVTAVLTGVAFGLVPALQATNPNVNEQLKEGGREPTASGRAGFRGALVVFEIALAVLLLISAGLLIRSFMRLQEIQVGFASDQLLTAQTFLSTPAYAENLRKVAFQSRVLEELSSLPGIEAAAAVSTLPFSGSDTSMSFNIEGQPEVSEDNRPAADYRAISPAYFATMKIPLQRGRAFTEADGAEAPGVAIISEALARRYFPGEDPIGKRVFIAQEEGGREIVGVVGDVRHSGLDVEPNPTLYVPYAQDPTRYMYFVVRSSLPPSGLIASLRRAVQRQDPNLPVYSTRTMEELLAESVSSRRFTMTVVGFFSVVALVLVIGGLYGVVASLVTQRTHEIGIRVALGARRGDILRLILGHGMRLAAWGIGIGLVAAFLLTGMIGSLLYGVSSTDAVTFAAIALLLTFVAVFASLLPALRATRIDPLQALRYE